MTSRNLNAWMYITTAHYLEAQCQHVGIAFYHLSLKLLLLQIFQGATSTLTVTGKVLSNHLLPNRASS